MWLFQRSQQADEGSDAKDRCPQWPRQIGKPASCEPATEEEGLDCPERCRKQGDRDCKEKVHGSFLGVVGKS